MNSLLHTYKSLELEAHISSDDVIAKVSEEAYELSEALGRNDTAEIEKESHDVIINIISASSRFLDIDTLIMVPVPEKVSQLDGLIARWSRETASLRGRYSRESVSLEQYKNTTTTLLSILIFLSGKKTINDIIGESVVKFQGRVKEYLPTLSLEDHIACFPNFPKEGILFRDISPLLAHPEALRYAGFELAKHAQDADVIAGLNARGFIFGTLVAHILDKPFVMIRKKGKLPGPTLGTDYSLEYGNNSIEIQKDAIQPGQKVVIIDDLLATGGTMRAAADLVEKVGGKVEAVLCVISLDEPFLASQPARKSLISEYHVESILHYD